MQAVEEYLKELLYDFECVTIPGLGGFIMQSNPARLNRNGSRIYPPSRYPSFNSLLNHDDGLLVSRIARQEQMSYHEAGFTVRDFVENLRSRLSLGEPVKIEGIGELSQGKDSGILFRPDHTLNYQVESFGMSSLPVTTLYASRKRPVQTARINSGLRTTPASRKPASVKWTLGLSVPIIAFLIYGIIFPATVREFCIHSSGMIADYIFPKSQPPVVIEVKDQPEPIKDIPPAIIPEENTNIATVTEVISGPLYYIIGGCFKNEKNAKDFLSGLKEKGYPAAEAGATSSGCVRISYKSFADKSAALTYLEKIKKTENPSAWLLKY